MNPHDAALDLRNVEREAALTWLFDHQYPQLLRLAVLLGAGQDAEDLVAEAFCQLHRHWSRLRDPMAAPGYLRAVVCNLVRMHLRHLQVVRRHAEPPPPDVDSAESQVVLREDQHQVVEALRHLPERQRQALVLRYWMDLREHEVAEAMGITTGAVKAHVFRGMAALTKQLTAPQSVGQRSSGQQSVGQRSFGPRSSGQQSVGQPASAPAVRPGGGAVEPIGNQPIAKQGGG